MKKNPFLIVILCLLLALQPLVVAADNPTGEDASGETTGETTEETTEETVAEQEHFCVDTVSASDVTVVSGCRTIEAMYPLAGSERMLKTAQSAFVYETNTQTVIYAYNPDLQLSPGVLTKMLTALIALEYCDMDEEVTVKSYEFSTLPVAALRADPKLSDGEKISMGDLLYLLILGSCNDAALAIAAYVAGGEAAFVDLMNQKLDAIGCTNTHLVDCHGLNASDQHTTARDMAKIVEACIQNEDFCEIFSATNYKVPETNKAEARSLKSMNYLTEQTMLPKYNYAGVVGGFPSYGTTSGASIAFTGTKNNMDLIFVVMGATRTYNDRGISDYYGNFDEAVELIEYVFNGFRIYRMIYEGQALKQFQVSNGEQDVVGYPAISIDTVLPKDTKSTNLIEKYTSASGGIAAPIAAGDQIASVQLWYGTSCLAEVELYASSQVRALDNTGLTISGASRKDSVVKGVFTFFGVMILVLVVLFGLYLAYNSYRRAQAQARRRRRRASRRRSR